MRVVGSVSSVGIGGGGDSGGIGISSEHSVLGLASDSLLGSLESLSGLLGGVYREKLVSERGKKN